MRRIGARSIGWMLVALSAPALWLSPAAPAWAQRGGGGGGRGGFGFDSVSLLNQKSVQDELKLTDEQRKKASEAAEKSRGGFEGFRDLSQEDRRKKMSERSAASDKTAAEILQPEQLKRLQQISLQEQGVMAFERPEVESALQLTNDQKDKLKTIRDGAREKMREAFGGSGQPDRQKIRDARKSITDQAVSVLTDEQKSKWKDLQGEPFTGEITRPNFGGGNDGGGRRRNN